MNIVLASTSPRRHELLTRLNLPFNVVSVSVNEDILVGEQPQDYILRMVSIKANAYIQTLYGENVLSDSTLVITADTIGLLVNNEVLTKPTSKQHAFEMWQKMAGTHHFVWTAVQATLIDQASKVVWSKQIIETTRVYFTQLTMQEMNAYWETAEPRDKAGGYAIQGLAAAWVERIEGSYTNVVGLPLAQTKALINQAYNYNKGQSLKV
ncbi:MAG: septum formation protein Maf [Gammaproteobacteria bacterium]|nr:MAG: septum formation protein Maf [Gammaproteobacteria bacterium]